MKINPISPHIRKQKRKKPNDRKYLEWVRKQPSALSGKTPCVAAHYRTSKNSGIGLKPLFSAIPLTDAEHREQHRIGQFNFKPREWWIEKVNHYVTEWKRENE